MKKVINLLGVLCFLVIAIMLCVPNSVKASEMSDEFRTYLNDNGKFEINSAIPTYEDYFDLIVDLITYDEQQNYLGICLLNVADDYSEVDLVLNCYEDNEEKHRVEIQWNYNENANEKIQNFMNTTLKNKNEFTVNDLELVNYWFNSIKNGYNAQLIMFSGELKAALNYGNIEFEVSTRGGGGYPFKSETIGFAYFGYDGSVYHVVNGFGSTADHIIYVPTETENTKEAIGAAAQKRIDDYLGETDVEVNYMSTAWEYWVSYFYYEMRDEWFLDNPGLTLEEFEQMGNIYMPAYPSFEEGFETELGLSGVNEDDLIYTIDIPIDENMGDSKYVIIRRDSSKMVTPISKTSDLSTDIEISTNATLPLDTIIEAKELTSGTEYERILSILDLTDNLTFDLKLYSNSTNNYITKLDNGMFEVKIPVPEKFEGKKLVVYYVNENDETEEYEVKIKDGYASFNTTHFSIYTLGYSSPSQMNGEVNPNTGDDIMLYVVITIISLIGLVTLLIFKKKYN